VNRNYFNRDWNKPKITHVLKKDHNYEVKTDVSEEVRKCIQQYIIKNIMRSQDPTLTGLIDYLTDCAPGLADLITTKTIAQLFEEEKKSIKLYRIDQGKESVIDESAGSQKSLFDNRNEDNNYKTKVDDNDNCIVKLSPHKNEVNTNTKLIQLFEYLKAYRSKLEEPIRNISKYEEIVCWHHDIPIGEGCFIVAGDDSQDSWLIVKKQEIPKPPQPPMEIKDWILGQWWDPFSKLQVKEVMYIEEEPYENHDKEMDKRKEIRFNDDIKRVLIWKEWFNKKWLPWSVEAQHKTKVKQLYTKLFLLSQRLEREQEDLELVWGHGMLYWHINNYQIRHPLFTTKVTIDFDDKHGIIKITPGMTPTTVETNFLQGMNTDTNYVKILMRIQQIILENPVDPWDKSACTDYFNSIVNQLSPEGTLNFEGHNLFPTGNPVIAYEPVIFLRRKKLGYIQDIESILEGLRQGNIVTAPIKNIVDTDDDFIENDDEWPTSDEEILLPLSTNNEQFQIIERLTHHIGVTVQGPPGTGKSHTIANLISHLLAHGKKVLVTAKAERPLKVLREKIPESIRSFCVSVLSDDSGSFSELEQAVRSMCEDVISLDKKVASQTVANLKEQLKGVRQEIAELKQRIKDISKKEMTTYNLLGKEYSLAELGKWLSENEPVLGYIPDKLGQNDEFPLSDKELMRFFELAGLICFEDRALLNYKLPDITMLPDGAYMNMLVNNIAAYDKKTHTDFLKSWEMPSSVDIEKVSNLLNECAAINSEVEDFFNSPWLSLVFRDVEKGGSLYEMWKNLYDWIMDQKEQLIKLKQYTSQYEITLPKDHTLLELKDMIQGLDEYFKQGKKVGFLTGLFNSKFKYVLNNCFINGATIKNKDDTSILLSEIEQQLIKDRVTKRWEKEVSSIGGPKIEPNTIRFEAIIDDYASLIKNVINWHQNKWKSLKIKIQDIGLTFKDSSPDSLKTVKNQLTDILNLLYLNDLKGKYKVVEKFLEDNIGDINASVLWRNLHQALKDHDWQKWDRIIERIIELKKVEKLELEFSRLKSLLENIAPQWVGNILKQGGRGNPLTAPNNVKEAWEWRKAQTWLDSVLSDDPVILTKRVDQLKEQESRIVIDLVTLSTRLYLAKHVTEEQRRSLIAWQQVVRKIGKGTGKYAAYRKQVAQTEMQKARNAVPVWIMPINKVIESFLPWEDPFDVIIVDESSQVDIFGILAIFRAKKVLIVGDDKQISPQGVGINLEQIHGLIDQYLEGLPHKELYEPQYSLYDLAKQVFPGVIMLKEHFRCLPEIIQFSNDLMYQGEILPLREREPWLGEDWQPVEAIKVNNGYREPGLKINEPEAKALVEKVISCCNDTRYNNMTIGIISLLGKEQAELIEKMLLEQLGPEEIRKRRIRCGDAYYFQGDERDIMFLSLVEARGEQRIATLNKEDDRRRFNVAASRAKNKLFLFYSIDPDEFYPEDVRAKLIRYCLNPHRNVEQYAPLEEACESEFERKVLKDLINLGYAVKPQYKVGHKRIDFVVFGMKDRLAVECDGDAYHGPERWEDDWNRQLLLERLGWKFFRIRGSQYFRDKQRTIKQLVEVLTDMGIKPIF
jgi:very-short-patch-repair endonuclease